MNHVVGQPTDETVLGTEQSEIGLRQYADWWMWARKSVRGPYPRVRAAAQAGINAQAGGAVVASAMATAMQVARDGPYERAPVDELAQRYAEVYVRARLARRLGPVAAHELAANALSRSKPEADITKVVGARLNVQALVAAALAGLAGSCLAAGVIIRSSGYGELPWVSVETWTFGPLIAAFLAFVFGIISVPVGLFAKSRIKYTRERGGGLATASWIFGGLVVLAAPFAGILFLAPLVLGAMIV